MATDWFVGSERNVAFFVGLARAFAGALIFALPMLMTMEMWWLGFYADPFKLALLLVVLLPLLVGLSYYGGFKPTTSLRDDIVDAFVAVAIAFLAAAVILALMAILRPGMSFDEILGKIAIQVFPASLGAMLARAQLGEQQGPRQEQHRRQARYPGELFIMAVGALFLSLNVAPTEEMVLIAYKMSVWHQVLLAIFSLLLMHAFVYRLGFRGHHRPPGAVTAGSLFVRFTLVGYAIVLLIGLYILWTFGRTTGTALAEIVSAAVVVGFPGAVGAAAARLIL